MTKNIRMKQVQTNRPALAAMLALLLTAFQASTCEGAELAVEKVRVKPNSYVAVQKKGANYDIYLASFYPPEKQLLAHVAPEDIKYPGKDGFPSCLKTCFDDFLSNRAVSSKKDRPFLNLDLICKHANGASQVICKAEDIVGGDDYPMRYFAIDIRNRKVYMSPLFRNYGDFYKLTQDIGGGYFAVGDTCLDTPDNNGRRYTRGRFIVFSFPSMKVAGEKIHAIDETYNIEGISRKGTYTVASSVGKAERLTGKPPLIYNRHTGAFKSVESLPDRLNACGFVDDKRLLIIDEKKNGVLIDVEGEAKPEVVFTVPGKGLTAFCGKDHEIASNNFPYFLIRNADLSMHEKIRLKGQGHIPSHIPYYIYDANRKKLDPVPGIKERAAGFFTDLKPLGMSADFTTLLLKYVVYHEGGRDTTEKYYLWKSGAMTNITKKHNKLFGK